MASCLYLMHNATYSTANKHKGNQWTTSMKYSKYGQMPSVSTVVQLPSRLVPSQPLTKMVLNKLRHKGRNSHWRNIGHADDTWSRSDQVWNPGGRPSKSFVKGKGLISEEHGLSSNNTGSLWVTVQPTSKDTTTKKPMSKFRCCDFSRDKRQDFCACCRWLCNIWTVCCCFHCWNRWGAASWYLLLWMPWLWTLFWWMSRNNNN